MIEVSGLKIDDRLHAPVYQNLMDVAAVVAPFLNKPLSYSL